jgi:hypothetical protein
MVFAEGIFFYALSGDKRNEPHLDLRGELMMKIIFVMLAVIMFIGLLTRGSLHPRFEGENKK